MPTYANEYEGFGNALMNLGATYYSTQEKKKEEERLRKEKEDERKYLADQAEAEWQRRAPLAALKEKLVEAQTAAAEAQKMKATVQTFAPKTQLLGNIARTTMPNVGPDGTVSYESTDETVAPLNPYQPRERSPFTRVGNDLVDTRTMQPVYKGESTAKAAKPLFTEKDLLAAKTKLNQMQIDLGKILVPADKAAAQSAIDNQMGIVETIKQRIETPLMKPAADASTPAPNPDAAAVADINSGKAPAGSNTNMIPQRETPAWKAAYIAGLAAAKAEGFTGDEAVAEAEAYADIAAE